MELSVISCGPYQQMEFAQLETATVQLLSVPETIPQESRVTTSPTYTITCYPVIKFSTQVT